MSAVVEEKAIKVTATDKVKPGIPRIHRQGEKDKSTATFTVNVAKAPPVVQHPGSHGQTNDSQNVKPEEGPLTLERTTVSVPTGMSKFVKVLKGAFRSFESKEKSFKVVPDGPNRLKIAADTFAAVGIYKVALKGKIGPDVDLTVRVPAPPSRRIFGLKMKQAEVLLTEGKPETRLVEVAEGWASQVKTKTPIEGLTATVENQPIHVVISKYSGSGYKQGEVLTVDSGMAHLREPAADSAAQTGKVLLKVTSVDSIGAVKGVVIESAENYRPLLRSLDVPATDGSGMGAMFDLTNNVKIVASDKLKAGTYEVDIHGQGGGLIILKVIVNAPKASALPQVAPDALSAAILSGARPSRKISRVDGEIPKSFCREALAIVPFWQHQSLSQGAATAYGKSVAQLPYFLRGGHFGSQTSFCHLSLSNWPVAGPGNPNAPIQLPKEI